MGLEEGRNIRYRKTKYLGSKGANKEAPMSEMMYKGLLEGETERNKSIVRSSFYLTKWRIINRRT